MGCSNPRTKSLTHNCIRNSVKIFWFVAILQVWGWPHFTPQPWSMRQREGRWRAQYHFHTACFRPAPICLLCQRTVVVRNPPLCESYWSVQRTTLLCLDCSTPPLVCQTTKVTVTQCTHDFQAGILYRLHLWDGYALQPLCRGPTMRQLRWGLKAEFPYTKVFILGILLTVLGSACVIISVVGIVKLAWGYYVSTGMWGGVMVTISGLAAMYTARARTSMSARLYFFLSIMTCAVSFAMLVLSAGGLTYKSNFYQPVRFDSERHQVTLFLHGSVLGVSVLSLACNVLSVIVCFKFMTREKDSPEEGFKLRRRRHRFSDPNTVYRSSSLRGGSGTVRSSTSSRTPLFGSDRSRKHSRQDSDNSTNLKIRGERVPHRRDSDRSRGSSRSRHSHHRQSSLVSQQSRYSGPMEAEVMTVLLRDTQSSQPNSLSERRERTSSHSASDNPRDSQADTITDNVSVQLVFDPDEEPPPPYEENAPAVVVLSDRDEADTETVDGSNNVVVPCYLPLNIPVTQIGGAGERQTQSLQRQPPPSDAPRSRHAQQSRGGHNDGNVGIVNRTGSTPNSPDVNNSDERDNRINMMRMTLTGGGNRTVDVPHPHTPEDRSASPEICALTGARMTPVAAVQPDTIGVGNSSTLTSCVPPLHPSPDSSDTSIPGNAAAANQTPATSRYHSGTAHPLSSISPSALPAGIRSPNSAFRPVGRRIVPLSQGSPSHSVPMHNFFAPISSPGSAHHTVYSPIASPSTAPRYEASPTSPHHANNQASSSSESLARGGSAQSLSWKKIPLPMSHNHSNRTSSVPTKEVTSKSIPGPAVPLPREEGKDQDSQPQSQSLPRTGSKTADKVAAVANSRNPKNKERTRPAPASAETNSSRDAGSQFATLPVRHPPKDTLRSSDRQNAPWLSGDSHSAGGDCRSAFVGNQAVAVGNRSAVVGNHLSAVSSQPSAISCYPSAVSTQPSAVSCHPNAVSSEPNAIISHPTTVSSEPNANSSRPTAGCSKPSANSSRPTAMSSQPNAAVSRPIAVNSQPNVVISRPVGVSSQPSAVISRPIAVSNQPNAVVSRQPNAVVSRPVAVSSQPNAVVSRPIAVSSQPSAVISRPVGVSSQPNAVISRPVGVSSQPSAVISRPIAVSSQPSANSSHPIAVSSQPSANSSHPTGVSSQPGVLDSHSTAVGKHPTAVGLPNASPKNQVTQLDSVFSRRSAGCQATEEDGGIASSMDRTHRWVMGTLPSLLGTQFQGTTRNIAHVHSAAGAAGTRSSLLAPAGRRVGRAHGVWDRPSKTSVPASASSAVTASQPVAPQPSRPAAAGRSASPQRGSSSSRLPRYQPVRQPQLQPRDQPLVQPVQQPRPHRQQHQQQQEQLQPAQVQQLPPPQQQQQSAVLRPQPVQRQLQPGQPPAEQQLQPAQQQLQPAQQELQPAQRQQQSAILRPRPAQRQLQPGQPLAEQPLQSAQQQLLPAPMRPQPAQRHLQPAQEQVRQVQQPAQQREEEREDQDQQQDKPLFSLLL